MQWTALFLLGFCLHVTANVRSQTITYTGKNVSLENVFKIIKQQTGYKVFTNSQLLKEAKSISVDAKDQPLNLFLEEILSSNDLQFELKGKTIIIGLKPEGDLKHWLSLSIPPITVRGRIINEKGEPVVASVTVKGTKRGTTTDANGNFEIENVYDDATLVISATNIETQEIKVDKRTTIVVKALTKVDAEQEVKIIGSTYMNSTKEKSTSSIVKITAKDIEKQPVTSPLMALQGRVPGLEITPNTGSPGNAPKIRIRGNNSLRSDGGFPLYIIDGIAIEAAPIRIGNTSLMAGGSDPLSLINPANIESIEVLKDADATSIYGSRGANGVIVIKTRQVKVDQHTNLDLSVYSGTGKIANRVELLNTRQYLNMRYEAFRNDNIIPDVDNAFDLVLWDTTRNTDWQKELLGGTARISDIQGSLTGGNASTTFRLSGGYHGETLVFPGDFGYKRANGSLSMNHTSLNKRLKASIIINYGHEKNDIFNDLNIINQALTLPPNAPALRAENGDLNWVPKPNGFSSFQNPLAVLQKKDNVTTRSLISNALLSYEIISGLSVKTNFGFTDLHNNETLIVPIVVSSPEFRASTQGQSTFINNNRNSWVIEPQLMYGKISDRHAVTAVIGSTIQNRNSDYKALFANGYTSDALLGSFGGAGSYSATEENSQYKYLSFFARIQYGYKDKYLVSASGRRDGSSRFGPERRFGNFYSIAPGWIFSNEPLLQNSLRFLSFGKIRGSYGTTGNDQIGDYKYFNTYRFGGIYQNGTSLTSTALFNPNFGWELTKKVEAAIELGFIENRILVEVNWYRNKSSNQLVEYQLPATTGFPSVNSNFNAKIKNSGLEVIVSTININSKKIKWNTSFNISIPKNNLVEFKDIENSPYKTTYQVGQPLSIQRLYIWEGIDYVSGLHKFSDVNGNGFLDDGDKVFMMPRDRKFYGGLINSLQYNNFELSFLFQFSKQDAPKYLKNMPGEFYNQPVEALSHWEKEGDNSNSPQISQNFSPNYIDFVNSTESSYNNENASFIRLKTLSIIYKLPKDILAKASVKECRIFLQGQNLLTITDYNNLDPETGSSMPPLRMFTVGLQLKF